MSLCHKETEAEFAQLLVLDEPPAGGRAQLVTGERAGDPRPPDTPPARFRARARPCWRYPECACRTVHTGLIGVREATDFLVKDV